MIEIQFFSRLVNKLFMFARVPLFAVHCNMYSDSHYHSLQFRYTFCIGLYYIICMKYKSIKILKWRPICEPNPQTGSRDPGITNFSIPDPGIENSIPGLQSLYTVFHKKDPFLFFHNLLKLWTIYVKFLPVVAEEMLVRNI